LPIFQPMLAAGLTASHAAHSRTPPRQDAGRPLHRRGQTPPADALAILEDDADVVEAEIVED
jgi:hypothetical protein